MSVRFGAHRIGFTTPAPGAIRRRHETPARGDAQGAIMRASGGALDTNLQLVRFLGHRDETPILGHWPIVGQNGYTHCYLKGTLRPLTRGERRMSTQAWVDHHGGGVAGLNALRKRGRRRGPINNFAMTWNQAVRFADRCDTIMTPELKAPGYLNKAVAASMASVCERYNYPLWPMTLLSMRYAKEKCASFRSQDLQFSLIFGKSRYLAYGANKIRLWKYKPTQIWGPKKAKGWL